MLLEKAYKKENAKGRTTEKERKGGPEDIAVQSWPIKLTPLDRRFM